MASQKVKKAADERRVDFAKRAYKALEGIAGAESHDEDAIDRARSLILAAYSPDEERHKDG